jgi:hypothetical protein
VRWRGVHCEENGECKANGVDDEMCKAPISAERSKIHVHVVAPLAQVVLELKIDVVGGVVEREVGDVHGYWLAWAAINVAAQEVSGGGEVKENKGV